MESVKLGSNADLADVVRRIIAGDHLAEEEMVRRYTEGVSVIVRKVAQSQPAAEDISQETFRIAIEKIRHGDVRDPERLSGFICSLAKNVAIEHVRKARRLTSQEEIKAELIPDPAPNQLEEVCRKEKARIVRHLIGQLKVERDRKVLFRYYIAEEDKDRICADLGLTRPQFNNILSRALQRYKELYIKFSAGQ